VNIKDKLGVTALKRAKMSGQSQVVKLLKQYGATEEKQWCNIPVNGGSRRNI
jgi:hypothetical protein